MSSALQMKSTKLQNENCTMHAKRIPINIVIFKIFQIKWPKSEEKINFGGRWVWLFDSSPTQNFVVTAWPWPHLCRPAAAASGHVWHPQRYSVWVLGRNSAGCAPVAVPRRWLAEPAWRGSSPVVSVGVADTWLPVGSRSGVLIANGISSKKKQPKRCVACICLQRLHSQRCRMVAPPLPAQAPTHTERSRPTHQITEPGPDQPRGQVSRVQVRCRQTSRVRSVGLD